MKINCLQRQFKDKFAYMIKAIDLIKKKMYFKMLAMLFSISSTSLKIVRTLMFFDVFVDCIFYPFKAFNTLKLGSRLTLRSAKKTALLKTCSK